MVTESTMSAFRGIQTCLLLLHLTGKTQFKDAVIHDRNKTFGLKDGQLFLFAFLFHFLLSCNWTVHILCCQRWRRRHFALWERDVQPEWMWTYKLALQRRRQHIASRAGHTRAGWWTCQSQIRPIGRWRELCSGSKEGQSRGCRSLQLQTGQRI